jgi:pilin isopeptide linkage protein
MITDVSDGITNGYTLTKRNNEDGEVLFNDIEYSRPGTYKYEIVQLSTNSNHIYYDTNKILLTVTLTDNGDNTMDVLGIYEYFNDEESFINKYSEEPIVKEEEKEVIPKNPNTLDRSVLVFILLLVAFALFIIERRVRRRRYEIRA